MKNNRFDAVAGCFVKIASLLTALLLAVIVLTVTVRGLPWMKASLFALHYNSVNVSLMPALFNTLVITLLALLFSIPSGVGAAIWLTEYARRGNRFISLVRVLTETLAGIPSIIYGLFGLLFFVMFCHFGISVLSGSLTLAIMILPLIMRTAEEALRTVPDSYREGSFGLGAGRLRTTMKVVLPAAAPGIFAGIVLAVGRVVGETAALIYTSGTVAEFVTGLGNSGRTLSVHMYTLAGEGLHIGQSYATALVLLVITIALNALAAFTARRFSYDKI